MDFETYISDVLSQLECNQGGKKQEHVVFTFDDCDIADHLDYFLRCFQKGLSAYKALTFFQDWRNSVESESWYKRTRKSNRFRIK